MRLSHTTRSAVSSRGTTDERGYILVMFALLLVPLLLMTGFAVDVGSWYSRASDMRKAADAAALAGVVWLPDLDEARIRALDAAASNGFEPGDGVVIDVEAASAQRLKVTITDESVGSFLWGGLGGREIALERTSYAEYVLPVPLGSPNNFIGTGLLQEKAVTGFPNEELFMSVNPYCTDKVNGDRYQSMSGPTTSATAQCSGPANVDYRSTGYETVVHAPVGRTSAIDVLLYDARFSLEENTGITDLVCGPVTEWSPWIEVPSNGSRSYTIPTRGEEQRWTFYWFFYAWSGSTAKPAGRHTVPNNTQYRYRYEVEREVCETRQVSEPAIDRQLSTRNTNTEPFTYTLFGPDDTVFDPTDNPVICSKTFQATTPFDYGPYLTSYRWNKLCSIPSGARSGDYVLRVTNSGNKATAANGANNYGVVARYANLTGHGLCDGRFDPMCPRVHGRDALSVQAASEATTAEFYLAEIDPDHEGKFLRLTLFDPGEGGRYIRIKKPTGDGNWAPVSFKWLSPGVSGSGQTTDNLAVQVSGSDRFNGRLVTIEVPLAGYAPPANNHWWKIEYEFGGDTVSDRTTWQAEVIGDPVHLTEDVPD